ncbi:hypothetical protein MRB53_022471 [Persea americana]|uniref:Uncharacterized protein n=1 Tax=Persea americana TaxID=3435 RepID=A0ACC2L710_PERAE|nr:hypothetical protein MRB53_022471 [Persea americana]
MTPMQGQPPHVPPVQQQQLAYHPGQQIHHQAMQLPQQQHLPHQQPHFPQQQGHAPVQQPQPFPGQAPGTVHNQQHQQSPFAPPQPIQPLQSLRPQGLPLHQPAHSQPQLQQNFPLAQGLATHHSQNPAGRTMVPNQALMHQLPNQTPVGLAGSILGQDVHSVTKVIQPGAGQPSPNQGILSWTNNHPPLASDQQPGPLQQSLLPRSDIQSTLLSVSSHSRKNAQVSAAQATLKPIFSEKSQGDSMPGKAGEVPKLDADGTNVSVSRVAELKAPISENDLKSSEGEEKMVDGSDDKGRPDRAVNEIDSSMKHEKDLKSSENDGDSEEPVIKQMVKEETSEKFESTEAGNDEKEDEASQHTVKEVQDGPAHRSLSSLAAENLEGKDVTLRQDPVDSHILRPWSDGSGSLNSHSGTDKGPRGQALGAVPERSMHALLRPPIVGPGYERPLPHPGYHDKNLPQFPHQGSVPDEHRGLLSPGQMPGKNFVHPSHFAPVPDQDRYHLPAPYGPSPLMQDRVSQRPPGTGGMFPPSMSLPGTSHERNFQEPVALQMQMHGPPMAHMRPQGRNALEGFPEHQQGQPSIAQEHFQTPMTKQPHGSFPSEIPPGGFPGRGMPPLFGREPSLLGPPQGFELQSSGPHGHRQGLMRPPYAGSQRTSQGKGAVGGMQDTSFLHGLPEERFKPFPEERYKPGLEEGFKPPADERFQPFPLDSGRRVVDRREFEEDLKQFPRPANLDGENMSRPLDRGPHTFGERPSHVLSRDIGLKSDGGAGVPSGSAFPVGSGGPLHLVEAGDRLRPEFGRHPARSPGREHPGLPSSRFGNSPAGLGLGSQPRLEDLDGRDLHGFGERWLRRAELDGPGSLRMNEQLGSGRSLHLRSGDMVGPDLLPIHLRGGEPIGHGSLLNHVRSGEPRNLPGHLHLGDPLGPGQLRIGEPTTFGGIPSHLRMGGPGHLPSHLRIGESVGGGNFPSHLRIAEPGFGSGFPMQGFQGGPQGDMESFDHSRKRKPGSTGWCRICKIDCESVEGLELHSQTREHQKMAMEMVLSIKQDNAKKQTLSSEEHVSREDANKKRKTNFETRGTRK